MPTVFCCRMIWIRYSKDMSKLPRLLFLLFTSTCFIICASAVPSIGKKRCRTTDDLGRIPWFLPNSTFYNLGFPLIRTLCNLPKRNSMSYEVLGCGNATRIHYLHESERNLRFGNRSSTIIVDPHRMEGLDVASSGVYVIMAMFEILLDLGYHPGVRHWSRGLNSMFPAHVVAAAMKLSRQYEASIAGTGPNPYATTANIVMFQVEVPFDNEPTVPVNHSPYVRTFQWMIGLHQLRNHEVYQASDNTSHCTGANFFLGSGHLCGTSGVIPCPQYDFHRKRSREVTPETRKTMKKNIILFDDDQNELDTHLLRGEITKYGGLDDLEMIVNQGRKRNEMPDLYKQVKMTIDCRNPGVEFINYEATLYDVMTLSCDMRATRNVFDLPVPSKYHINPHNWTRLGKLIHDSLVNYEQRIDDFKHFKRLSRSSNQIAKTQADIHFFSRDVLFRTHCASYAECRRVYPWAVAVWTLYPLAMIEVVSEVDLIELALDSDLVRMSLSGLLNSKFFTIYNSIPGVAPVDMFPRTPCAYMVYMDASFIPFGRDFLNTHVAALVKDPRPILYWQGDKKLAIAVMHARPYAKLVRTESQPEVTYIELNFTFCIVADVAVAQVLPGVLGNVKIVDQEHLSKLPIGDPFTQERFKELATKNPPLQQQRCDPAATSYTTGFTGISTLRRRLATAVVNSVEKNVVHRQNHTTRGFALRGAQHGQHSRSHQPYLHHHQELFYGARRPRCVPQEHLIIDALYIPMPVVGDHSEEHSEQPTLWLTSSLLPLTLNTVFDTFSVAQIKTIVQHLDPILQNPYVRKIMSLIPSDIADVLKMFDAADYPDVISLRDMEYSHWGEKCG